MPLQNQRIVPVYIEEEMKDSYIDYSMSVIVSRALPDVRDGLKPVHRRILYAMNEMGMLSSRPFKKSARIVGEVLGKYHPHGDMAVYETMVRMVQDFSLRYPLIDGQGNFGSIDGDPAAAMRYTEARLTKIAEEMLKDIDKNTVSFVPNFDGTLKEPSVLPTVFPNLIVNGTAGIAVGMATNIPPHNLSEVIEGLIALIDRPEMEIVELMKFITAPDFPTGGIIYGCEGVRDAYLTGRGKIIIRARANIEKVKGEKENIVISEIPYQINKSALIEKMADLVKDKKIEGIYDIRDESDRDGLRIVIELKRDAQAEVILNQLYKHTQMQITYGVIMLALVNGAPKVLNLKETLSLFIEYYHDVVVKRTKFDLEAAEKKAHILEGLKIAIDNIDEIITLIKKSKDPQIAKESLMKRFNLSEVQAKAILDMRLQRLTGLERDKIENDYLETIKLISKLKAILESRSLRMNIIKDELMELDKKYGDERRTEIIKDYTEFSLEDIIAEEDMVITISHSGFIKRFPVSGYRRQQRGGRGSMGAVIKSEDFVEHLFIASTHHYILFFTDKGRCYCLKVHELPQGGKAFKGRAIVNLIEKEKDENIAAFVSVKEFDDKHYIIMATEKGIIKKTPLSSFRNPRKKGVNAINILQGDRLIETKVTDGTQDIILGTYYGQAIRFRESDVRSMGKTASGVKAIKLSEGDRVVGMFTVRIGGSILNVTEKGYGKRSNIKDYRLTRRGGKGIKTIKITEKTGKMIALMGVIDNDDLMIITANGVIIRQHVKNIRVISRNTQGVRLIKLDENDIIADIAKVIREEENKNNEEDNIQDE